MSNIRTNYSNRVAPSDVVAKVVAAEAVKLSAVFAENLLDRRDDSAATAQYLADELGGLEACLLHHVRETRRIRWRNYAWVAALLTAMAVREFFR